MTAVAPDSVRIIPGNVTEVELRGSAFDVSSTPENVVHIGPLLFRGVPGTNGGTRLRVAIPATMPSAGEAPPSPLLGGRYAVFVTTTRGISDTLSLAIFMFGAAP